MTPLARSLLNLIEAAEEFDRVPYGDMRRELVSNSVEDAERAFIVELKRAMEDVP